MFRNLLVELDYIVLRAVNSRLRLNRLLISKFWGLMPRSWLYWGVCHAHGITSREKYPRDLFKAVSCDEILDHLRSEP